MKKFLISGAVLVSVLVMPLAQAATVCDAKTNLTEARAKLVEMVKAGDKAAKGEGTLRAKVDAATTKLEEAYTALLADDNKADDADLGKFKETWEAFKKTREEEIMPALEKGDTKKATEIAQGVQKERMATMNGIIEKNGGKDCK